MIDTQTPVVQNGAMTNETLIGLIRSIIEGFTRHPHNLKIESQKAGSKMLISISADRDDHPRLVGSKGAMVLALKTVTERIGAALGIVIRFTLLEPSVGQRQGATPYEENPDWNPLPAFRLLKETVELMSKNRGSTVEHNPADQKTGVAVFTVTPPLAERREWESEALGTYLDTIWHSIGKHQGHHIVVEVVNA